MSMQEAKRNMQSIYEELNGFCNGNFNRMVDFRITVIMERKTDYEMR